MENNTLHKLGIDIGSTTVKVAVLDEHDNLLFSDYERHFANIRETLSSLIQKIPDAPQLSFIAGASTEVSCQIGPDLIIRRIRILPKQRDRIHDKSRITEAALIRSLIGNKSDKL